MKIYLFLSDKILNFSLPMDVSGSFSFDENLDEESKLVNIEARNSEWIIYSTQDALLVDNNDVSISSMKLESDTFYLIKRNNQKFLIYVSDLKINNLETYSYGNDIDLLIGNFDGANVRYSCSFLSKLQVRIRYIDNMLVMESNDNNYGVYVSGKSVSNKYYINFGEQINIFGLKIMFLNKMLFINTSSKLVTVMSSTNISKYVFPVNSDIQNIDIKDIDLYGVNDYFSKAPRIRRIIETKTIKLSPPPQPESNQELPLILTIGPMLTMGVTSSAMMLDVINKISTHQTTFKDSWLTLLTSFTMIVSMLLWPILTNIYNKKMKIKRKEEVIFKYSKYLDEKREELRLEQKLQRDILVENLITVEECLNIIKNRNMNFWDKRIDQNDFLTVRIGVGDELLDVKVEYPEEGFTIEENELRKQADKMVSEFKYIDNVPISYSFYDNKVTAIMGTNRYKSLNFMSNVILQLITFYSYEDLKLVVFTNENNMTDWEFIKYFNHNFDNEKDVRFFASNLDSTKNVAEYLNVITNSRVISNDNVKNFKPHYLVIIDDYDRVKRFDFLKTITEMDENIGFSIVILEERMSRLPSKCNNFITLGVNSSGVLKNSYEKQEQVVFNDEINYNVNMMNIAKVISNIPIEFEKGIKNLPDAISFMEMERVGKVEQLNILNRWNVNDATTSLKAEIGVDEQGDLMYLDLHEKYHGPHGLIAGTTGSGKSEFIITYILSMAINYCPDDVAFILIDYKGGGLALAFENKITGISLPHLAGTITNLDKAEMDRTLVSIDSEVKRRQHMFNEARDKLGESTIDIYKYQRFYNEGKLNNPIPHLFIICDEFAELKAQQPDFMDNLISVARIGRSLGVHLILATQKPSGVVNDQIWSNTKFRVCLKVQDESDSKEMLKRPEAASLKQAGRYYLQVGYDEYFALGQSGWCGAKYYPSEKIVKSVDKSINFIDDCGNFIKSIQASSGIKIEAQGEQLSAIMKNIIEVSDKVDKKARKLWLDNIPPVILADFIEKKYNVSRQMYNVSAVIGEYDAPEKQEQGLVLYNYLENGNTIIYGTDGGENEMLLTTIIYSTIMFHNASEINYYVVDYGSESLRKFSALPHFGGIVYAGEDEKFNNLLKMIKEELSLRKKLFADYGGEYTSYIKNSSNKLPLFVVIVNNYDSVYEANQNIYDILPELVRDSYRYGVIFIFTANAINSIPGKTSQNCPTIYTFKLKDSSDYASVFNVKTKIVPRDVFGRGLLCNDGVHEFQTCSIIEDSDNLTEYIQQVVNKQNEISMVRAKKIPILPDIIRIKDIQNEISTLNNVPIGISRVGLEVVTVDYKVNIGNIISSTKIANTEKFVRSLLVILNNVPSVSLMVLDPMKVLMLDTQYYLNYYNDNFDIVILKITDYIQELIDNKSQSNGVILIYGINKLLSKLEDASCFDNLISKLKLYEKWSIIIVDDVSKLKDYTFEDWFTSIFTVNDGIWVGKGISEQSIFRISTITKDMMENIKNDMGYLISENMGEMIKMIDFVTKDEEASGEK